MVVSCEICGKQFDSFRGLNGHRNAHIKRAESLDAEQTPFVWCVVRAFNEDDGSGMLPAVENTEVLGVFKYKKDADKALKSVYNEMKSQGLEEDYDKEGFYTDNGFIHTTKSKLGQLWMPYGAYRFWNAESFSAHDGCSLCGYDLQVLVHERCSNSECLSHDNLDAESYKPPASAVAAAKKGLSQRKEWGRGGMSPSEAKSQGIDSGVTRARKISSGSVSRHDVRRMSAFNRHRQNNRPEKKMPDGGPTAGTIAWNLWGGTSGVNWAKKKSAAMDAETFDAERGCSYSCPDCGTMMYQHDSNTGFGSYCSCFKCGSKYITRPMNAESESKNAESASDPEIPEIISYQKNKYSMDLVVEYRGRKHDLELMIYQGYDAEEGQLAKALAAVRDKAKRYAPTPLRLTKLPHPDQKSLKDFEADEWKLLPRDSLGRWQKPVRSESINELRESLQTSVPAISELLNLYGGDNPNNRFKLYNDLQSLKIDAMDAALPDDTNMTLDNLDMSWMTPREYYEYILEEPIDVPDDTEDDSTTIEFQERLVRYTAMTMLPQEVESLIKENAAEITEDLFADNEEADSEINFLNAVKRYQKLSEQWSAEE